MLKPMCTLLAVRDMERSKSFYTRLFHLSIECDLGANVSLSGNIALQTLSTWKDFINMPEDSVRFGGNDAELYFECGDIDAFVIEAVSYGKIEYVHRLKEHAWGQRVVRIYDPDRHIIEVGESMGVVTRRFLAQGMTREQAAHRMGVPLEAVKYYLEE